MKNDLRSQVARHLMRAGFVRKWETALSEADDLFAEVPALTASKDNGLRLLPPIPDRFPLLFRQGYQLAVDRLLNGHSESADWPSREDFSRMTTGEVNAYFAEMGFDVRVIDTPGEHEAAPWCWCGPTVAHEDPATGDRVYAHRRANDEPHTETPRPKDGA